VPALAPLAPADPLLPCPAVPLEIKTEIKALIGSIGVDEMDGAALGPINAANNGAGAGALALDLIRLVHNTVGQSAAPGESIGEPTDVNRTCGSGSTCGPEVAAIQNAAPAAATPAIKAVRAIVELRSTVDISVSPTSLVVCVGSIAAT